MSRSCIWQQLLIFLATVGAAKADFSNRDNRQSRDWNIIPMSLQARLTVDPLADFNDATNAVTPNANKSIINMQFGDPSLSTVLLPSSFAVKAIEMAVNSGKYNGYDEAFGVEEARKAVARHAPGSGVTADDVIMTSGCSHGLEISLEALSNPGDNVLVPAPGFLLYSMLTRPRGVEDRLYNINLSNGGVIDLQHLESLIDNRTRAIIVNNPANPLGSVYSKDLLQNLLRIADAYRVPIISDEIYGELTFGEGAKFFSLATLEPKVPLITCNSLSKQFLTPGWRLGWLVIYDVHGALTQIREGIRSLAEKIDGPSVLTQGALPLILDQTPTSFFEHTRSVLATNAKIFDKKLSPVRGLNLIRPQGSIYIFIEIDAQSLGNDTDFLLDLIREESVYSTPGIGFHASNAMRLLLIYEPSVTEEVCDRIVAFCNRRLRNESPQPTQSRSHRDVAFASFSFLTTSLFCFYYVLL